MLGVIVGSSFMICHEQVLKGNLVYPMQLHIMGLASGLQDLQL